MKALQISNYGKAAEVIEIIDIEEPTPPAAGSVTVELEYAAINPATLLMMSGLYGIRPTLPAPMGGEGVGRVAQDCAGERDALLLPVDVLVGSLQRLDLEGSEAIRFCHGQRLERHDVSDGLLRIYAAGMFAGVAAAAAGVLRRLCRKTNSSRYTWSWALLTPW